MSNTKSTVHQLCEILDCNPRTISEEGKRIKSVECNGGNKIEITYIDNAGNYVNSSIEGSIRDIPLACLNHLETMRGINFSKGKLSVHKWPEGLREIFWHHGADELIANLTRFKNLHTLRLDGDTGKNITIPIDIAPHLEILAVSGYDVRKLDGFNLSRLGLRNPKFFENFHDMPKLEKFTGIGLSTVEGIRAMPNLKRLTIADSSITDIAACAALTGIKHINIKGGYIHDITAFSGLVEMEVLNITDNLIEDITPLSGMNLYHLDISSNPVGGIAALEGHSNLESLNIRDTFITDLSPLGNHPNLRYITLDVHKLRDRQQLRKLSGLVSINGMITSEALWYYKVKPL